jgi:hypothetical protein
MRHCFSLDAQQMRFRRADAPIDASIAKYASRDFSRMRAENLSGVVDGFYN